MYVFPLHSQVLDCEVFLFSPCSPECENDEKMLITLAVGLVSDDQGTSSWLSCPSRAVSLKLPTFLPKNPDVWVLQTESQFELSNITVQRTKFNNVLVVLP
jgi:hypothetical protein